LHFQREIRAMNSLAFLVMQGDSMILNSASL